MRCIKNLLWQLLCVLPGSFFIVFHKVECTVSTIMTIMTIAMSFPESLSPGLGICWPSPCEGWGLCPSQVLTRNDETMCYGDFIAYVVELINQGVIPRRHSESTSKCLMNEISILTFCDTFERTSWNTMWESPSIIGDCQTRNSAWHHDQAFILQICLRTSVIYTFTTPLRPSCSTVTASRRCLSVCTLRKVDKLSFNGC